jgi:hypothetical protein
MAEKRTIDLNVNTNAKEASDDFEDLSGSINDAKKKTDALNNSVKATKDATDDAQSGFKKVTTAVKGIGTAFKAAGIGLIIGAFASLKSAFEQNQEVATTFSAVMETIAIVFNQTIGALITATKASYEATGGFNALGKVMGGLLTLILTPLKGSFYGIKLAIETLQLAWEKSFFGNKDEKVIKELRKNIKGTENDLVELGENAIKAGKDIYNNFGEAVGEVVDLGKRSVEEVSKISIKSAYEQANALVNAKNAAAIAAAQQGLLIEQYDRQAEKLRQIRDEERNSISERVKANNDLKAVLDSQEKAMLAQADLQIKSAQMELAKAKTTENQVALIEAQANRVGVLAQIEGLRSENLANDLALQREADELTKTRTESEITLAIERKKATNEFISDEELKIQAQIATAEEEKALQLARLQEQIDVYKEGTQGRLDAEIAYNEAKQAIDLQVLSYEDQLAKKRLENSVKAKADQKELDDKELERQKQISNERYQLAYDTLALISSVTELFGRRNEKAAKIAFGIDKAAKIASATIATIEGTIEAWKTAQKSPYTALFPGYPAVQAGLTAAFGAAGIAKIAQTKFSSSVQPVDIPTPSGGGEGAGSVMSANFNVVGNSGINQLAQLQQTPTKAYVVSGDMTTAQSLDRNRIENATLVQ